MGYNIIAVDFDGVISSYEGWKGVGKFGLPLPGAREALIELKRCGWCIVIFTTRGEEEAVGNFLRENGIPFDYINHNPPGLPGNLSNKKVIADVYIDDRAITFNGDWTEAVERIREFRPWYSNSELKKGGEKVSGVSDSESLNNIKDIIDLADGEHDKKFVELVGRMCLLKFEKTKQYGEDSYKSLGLKGIFVDLNRKYQRMKRYFWYGDRQMGVERIEDTLFDNAIYSLLMIMAIQGGVGEYGEEEKEENE